MNLSNLKPAAGAVHREKKRIGRGVGSGKGRTAAKGTKGAQSRSGYNQRSWFEGGQMPLQRRLPKRGFKNISRVSYTVFNLDKVEEIISAYKLKSFDHQELVEKKLVKKSEKVKVLGGGELEGKVEIRVHAVSKSAKEAIESAGGKINLI